jgi:predicted MFS family arabinose efflux permease
VDERRDRIRVNRAFMSEDSGNQSLRGVIALCVTIFFIDAANASAIPLYPFFARSLGASVTLIGALVSSTGLTTVLLSIPLGSLSDRLGRKRIMQFGIACSILAPLLYTFASEPLHLLPARIVLGVATGSTFSIGFVYVTEIAPKNQRGLAQGLYLTSMGAGFTVGPLVGGFAAKAMGYSSAFYITAGLAACGFIALLFAPEKEIDSTIPARSPFAGFRSLIGNPGLLSAGVANFFNSMIFNTVMIFFPLYGISIGLDESQVGMGLTVRGLASTVTRIPAGMAISRLGALKMMAFGLGASAVMILAVPAFDTLVLLSVILGLQGIFYGIYLTSANTFVTEVAPEGMEGASMGVFSTFSNISGIVSPIVLGAVAEAWGIDATFSVSFGLAVVGMVILSVISRLNARPRSP